MSYVFYKDITIFFKYLWRAAALRAPSGYPLHHRFAVVPLLSLSLHGA
jgi:hypothetical protein